MQIICATYNLGLELPGTCSTILVNTVRSFFFWSFPLDKMQSIDDAFDISTAAGSGSIMVVGPPGCGKSFAVIKYLHSKSHRSSSRGASMVPMQKRPRNDTAHVLVTYHALKALPEAHRQQPLQHLLRSILSELYGAGEGGSSAMLGRRAGEINLVMLAHLLNHYFRQQPEGSQLHVVLDDVDAAEAGQLEAVEAIISATTRLPSTSHVFVWVLARLPVPLSGCTRLHFIRKPSVELLASWLTSNSVPPPLLPAADASSHGRADLLVQAALHFAGNPPMSTSVMSSDPRLLLQCVAEALPTLTSVAKERGKVNQLDLAKAWSARGGPSSAANSATAMDIVVDGVRGLGATAMLLCVAVFYCGAVAPAKDRVVFGDEWDTQRRGQAAAHTESVLTSSSHAILRKRLLAVYRSLASMTQVACLRRGDVAASPLMAATHLRNLLDWGLMTHTSGGRVETYHSHITLNIATALANDLELRLLDLIPTR
ncbi:Hypothetical protein, putative [Bodo saltans]|uniref:Orc1-like AAA ATPase domain-containing protein n=1 Tax=Bodo saltans TaxID=75058 RepID=A0A0S4ISX7_BODSA|nr:Hypothetical protein, putative [Bodo saltans]|eukprot:CUE73106.1 Hypothetical protein, putative [Bodo saltans]